MLGLRSPIKPKPPETPQARYDIATRSTSSRKGDNSPGYVLTAAASPLARAEARHLDQNHDLARSVLNALVRGTIGTGIIFEFAPLRRDGTIHHELSQEFQYWWLKWCEQCETTREFHWMDLQQILARTYFRDGEYLIKDIYNRRYKYPFDIPYAIEALEADYLDSSREDPANMIYQGVQVNKWWQPTQYYLLDDPMYYGYGANVSRPPVSADIITHLKLVDRLRQPRGMSIFSSLYRRFNDLKDYEDSERIAAKIAASMVVAIERSQQFAGSLDTTVEREWEIGSGTIWDNLWPGEKAQILDNKRPNTNLLDFRNGQLRAACGGADVSYSSVAKDYSGTYSSQRQEMVETYIAYAQVGGKFGRKLSRVPKNVAKALVLSGKVKVPRNVDPDSLYDVDFTLPTMPWIDPQKEAEGMVKLKDSQLESPQELIRRRGRNPMNVLDEIRQWRQNAEEQQSEPGSEPESGDSGNTEQ